MSRLIYLTIAALLLVAQPLTHATAAPLTMQSRQADTPNWPYEVPHAFKQALDAADHSLMSPYLANTVELRLPDCSGIFSKKQAEMILSKFMATHHGMSFSVNREESISDATITIGSFSDGDISFGVYVLSQPAAGIQQIKQLRIEEQK